VTSNNLSTISLFLITALLARFAHRFPAADTAKRTVTSCTPDGPLNVVTTTPARTSGPCSSPQRLCGALAT